MFNTLNQLEYLSCVSFVFLFSFFKKGLVLFTIINMAHEYVGIQIFTYFSDKTPYHVSVQ